MANIVSTIFSEDEGRVVFRIIYNDAQPAGTDEEGNPYYTIRRIEAVNSGSNTYKVEAIQGGVVKHTANLTPGANIGLNLPANQQVTTINSTLSIVKI